jgi:hypothetical protein
MPVSLLLTLALAAPGPVTGTSTCPTPEDVASQAARLSSTPLPRVSVDANSKGVRLRLYAESEGSEPLAQRLLNEGTCVERARAAAAIVAAWAIELSTTAPSQSELRLVDPIQPPARRFRLGALGMLPLLPIAPAAEAFAELELGSDFVGRLAVSAQFGQSLPLALGTVHWTRASIALGLERILLKGSAELRAGLEAMGGWVWLWANGFDVDGSSNGADVGGGAALRFSLPLGPLALISSVEAIGWPVLRNARITGQTQTTRLPWGEVRLGLGLAFVSEPLKGSNP